MCKLLVPLVGLVVALATPLHAASPQDAAAGRREMLNDMLAQDPAHSIAAQRRICAAGREPAGVRARRADGSAHYPDAADSCVTALIRLARDQRLADLYTELWRQAGGAGEGGGATMPRLVGAAVLAGRTQVAVGGGRAAVVTPALAFDAGFTVAYEDRKPVASLDADPRQLKAVAEACLAQGQEVGTCFAAGYAFGTKAAAGWTVTAERGF